MSFTIGNISTKVYSCDYDNKDDNNYYSKDDDSNYDD